MEKNRIQRDLLIHDLKGPLAVAETSIRLMLMQREKYGPLTALQEKALNRALRNILTAKRRVRDALEIQRAEAGVLNVSPLEIKDLLSNAIVEVFELSDQQVFERLSSIGELDEFRAVLAEKSVGLAMAPELWTSRFLFDGFKVEQILRNLLSNALKHRKSKINLIIERREASLVFSVTDDGDGIAKRYHEKIFENYFQIPNTDTGPIRGHGIGLAGALVLAEDLGGSLQLESDEGKGAAFHVTVPIEGV